MPKIAVVNFSDCFAHARVPVEYSPYAIGTICAIYNVFPSYGCCRLQSISNNVERKRKQPGDNNMAVCKQEIIRN